jgi:phage tail sheath gpL-like
MGASIVLVGLGASFPNPGVFAEIDFAVGPAGPAPGVRNILLFGNKTASGSATVDTVVYGPNTAVPAQTEQDWINVFGAGSHLHRMFLRIAAVLGNNNPIGIYGIAVTASAGAAAAATMTIATAATSNGNHRFWCVDQFVDTPITSGDSAATIATNIITSINEQSRWPIVASSGGSGVVTLTAVVAGLEGNWIKVQALIAPGTSQVGTTTTLTANTKLTGGTTADSVAAAVATIAPTRYYYQVSHDSDATNIGRIVTQVNADAQPGVGIRQRVFAGSSDTLGNEITLATGLNAPRCEIESSIGSDLTPMEIAANNCALFALWEAATSEAGPGRDNFSLYPVSDLDNDFWLIIPSRDGSSVALTVPNITSALNNGITPLANVAGKLQLVKRVTSRSLNGAVQDYRIRDAHRVSVCDWWTDDAVFLTQQQFGGKNLAPNPQQGVPFPANSTCPRFWGAALKGLVRKYEAAGQLKNGDQIIGNMIVQQETTPADRMSALAPLQTIDLADQFMLLVQQVA